MREHLGGEFDQLIHLYLGRTLQRRTLGGRELERTHSTNSNVAEPLNCVEALGPSTQGGKPRIDQCIAEFIGQRIGEQARQAVEGHLR